MRTILVFLSILVPASWTFAQQSPHGAIKTACNICHTTDSWKMRMDATFDHSSTGFPLEGQHKAVPCASCHQGLKFTAVDTKCSSCHTDAHVGELGTDCARCHTPSTWSVPDMRQRHDQTRFPLLGAHATATCSDCHRGTSGRRYRGLPISCVSCHQANYKETSSPNHLAAGFSTECLQCHVLTAMSWGTGFEHGRTQFPLTGAHLQQQCQACHANNKFASLSTACVTCHQSNFNTAANPNHVSSGFPTLCQQCHTTTAWKPSSFDHDATRFALTGAHLAVACTDCHKNNQYVNLSTTCSSCHSGDFTKATNPNHVSAGFPQDCTQCHTTAAWQPASFNHSTTRFPLTGTHVATTCQSCHVNNNYQLAYTDCYQCHSTDFTRSTVINHAANSLSHDCTTCHTTTAWLPSTFNHDAQYFRIYSGTHRGTWSQCSTCHPNAAAFSSFTCLTCHEHAQSTMDAAHSSVSNYIYASPNCYSCHRNV